MIGKTLYGIAKSVLAVGLLGGSLFYAYKSQYDHACFDFLISQAIAVSAIRTLKEVQ